MERERVRVRKWDGVEEVVGWSKVEWIGKWDRERSSKKGRKMEWVE
jgi:hypothetical protein